MQQRGGWRLVLLLSVILVWFGGVALVERSAQGPEPWRNPTWAALHQSYVRQDASVPAGAVLFLGDSLTLGLATPAVAPDSVNWGIPGDTAAGILRRLHDYHAPWRARAVVLAVGVNDLLSRDDATILVDYDAILVRLSPTPVLCSAILPVDEDQRPDRRGQNARIRRLNAALRTLWRPAPGVVWVDAGAELVDEAGNLRDEYAPDGLHLNRAGYAIWVQHLQAGLAQLAREVTW